MTVDVKVHPTIKEFILNTNNGSDTLQPQKHDWLWLLLKQHLDTAPDELFIDREENPSYIKIELLDTCKKCYSKNPNRGNKDVSGDPHYIRINTLFRWYLSPTGQESIAKHFRNQFKEYFHNFVYASLLANPRLEQKQAIHLFCDDHDITFNAISEDMLTKSWQRSAQRKKFKEGTAFCPLNY